MNRNIKLTLLLCAALTVAVAGLELRPATVSAQAVTAKPSPMPQLSRTPVPDAKVDDRSRPLPSPTKVPQTLDSLRSFIAARLTRPEVARGRVGVKIASLNTGKVIYEQDADKYFMPASNMKNFTVATAMEKLGPDFKFVTRVFAATVPDSNGTIKGDLRILGGGDISISTAFFGTSPTDPETYYKGIDRLVDAIAAAGVKKIDGNIVGDESHFKGFAIPPTWEWDDLQWYYGAEVSALPINDNAVDLTVKAAAVGAPCVVNISPAEAMRLYQIVNTCSTTDAAIKKSLGVNKKIDRNILEISGTLPIGDKGFNDPITITHPADLFVAILKQRLEKRGIVVSGSTRTLSPAIPSSTSVEIAKLESVPFSEVAAKTLKPSQNLYTETILWTLGEWLRAKDAGEVRNSMPMYTSSDSADVGLVGVKAFLSEIGLPQDAVIQHDGCGMSRHDLITPSAVVTLYTYMAKQSKYAQAWRDALSIGGVDGTLASRFKGTAAAGNIRGKTGTIDQVSALSGYMTTLGGEPVVLSILVNDVPEGRMRVSLIDDITVAVANFDGKIE